MALLSSLFLWLFILGGRILCSPGRLHTCYVDVAKDVLKLLLVKNHFYFILCVFHCMNVSVPCLCLC